MDDYVFPFSRVNDAWTWCLFFVALHRFLFPFSLIPLIISSFDFFSGGRCTVWAGSYDSPFLMILLVDIYTFQRELHIFLWVGIYIGQSTNQILEIAFVLDVLCCGLPN